MEKKNKNTWLWILLCLPMIFIAYYAITLSDSDIDPADVKSITLTLPDEEKVTLKKQGDIDFYLNLYLEADPISEPLRDVSEETPINVLVDRTDGSFSFMLYPQVNTNGCFFRNENGKFFAVLSDHAKTLLQREECAYTYADWGYGLPELVFVTDGVEEAVAPAQYKWQYKNIGGKTVDYKDTDLDSGKLYSFYSDKGCTFKFSADPTEAPTYSFTDENGQVINAATPADLAFATDTKVNVRMEAGWAEKDHILGGKAVYEFQLLYDVIPSIVNTTNEVMAGDLVYITFRNLSETEQVKVETTLVTAEPDVFYSGSNSYVMLPISLKNAAGNYDLKFYMGDISESIVLTVKEKDFELNLVDKDTDLYTDFLSAEVKEQFDQMMAAWCAVDNTFAVETGKKFFAPTDGYKLYDFAAPLTINSIPGEKLSGIEYLTEEDTSVCATQSGTVVYVEENNPYYGNMVVIDHGHGVLSHYYHLGELKEFSFEGEAEPRILRAGDYVSCKDIIAKGGGSGMVNRQNGENLNMVHFAISVNGIYVNPNQLFESGIDIK